MPLRYGRMLRSPFTFLRGSAALMACDLASLPATGIGVQACGDCHLLNFGLFATPERNLVFDINDFDETLPAPGNGTSSGWRPASSSPGAITACPTTTAGRPPSSACAYRERLRDYSRMSPMEVWYSRLDVETIIEMAPDAATRRRRERLAEKAHDRIIEHLFPEDRQPGRGRYRFVDQPPIVYHPARATPTHACARGSRTTARRSRTSAGRSWIATGWKTSR